VNTVVGITNTVAVAASRLYILHQPVCEVVVVGSRPSGSRVRYRCRRAAVIIPVGDGISALVNRFCY